MKDLSDRRAGKNARHTTAVHQKLLPLEADSYGHKIGHKKMEFWALSSIGGFHNATLSDGNKTGHFSRPVNSDRLIFESFGDNIQPQFCPSFTSELVHQTHCHCWQDVRSVVLCAMYYFTVLTVQTVCECHHNNIRHSSSSAQDRQCWVGW